MTEPLKLTGVSKIKAVKAEQLLSDQAGLVILGDNGVFIGVKSPHVIFSRTEPDPRIKLYVLGICGTEAEKRTVEQEMSSFTSAVKNKFSARDLNLGLLQDFLMWYLQNTFYNKRTEKVMATEFILAQHIQGEMRIVLIHYDGNLETLNNHSLPAAIGCYDETKRKKMFKCLEKFDPSKQTAKQLNELGRMALRGCVGRVASGFFSFEPTKSKNKKRTRNNK